MQLTKAQAQISGGLQPEDCYDRGIIFTPSLRFNWMHHRQCCVSILFIALSLHVKPSPWCHTKANTKQICVCTCVCASSVHFNLVYVFPSILAFLLLHSSSLFCYESSCIYFDDEFHMTDISCSHQKVPLGWGCQPKITVGVLFYRFVSDLRMHAYMRAPSLGGVSFVFFLFPWQNLISSQFSSMAEVSRFKFTDQMVSISPWHKVAFGD